MREAVRLPAAPVIETRIHNPVKVGITEAAEVQL